MLRLGLATALLATIVAALVSVAHARPREGTVAIISIEITGDGAPELRNQLQRSIAGGLSSGGLRVVGLSDVISALSETPELIGCTSTTCLQRIGEKVGADYFVRTRIEAAGSAYSVEIELLSAKVAGGLVTRSERECPVCTIMEVNDLVSAAAKDMVELPPAKPVPVVIVTEPAGASIRVDEREVGKAPHRLNLDVGDHTVSVELPGYNRAERIITVSEHGAEPMNVEIALARSGTTAPPDDRLASRPFRTLKWVTAGGAAASLVTGIALVVLDGNDACAKSGDQEQCAEVYDTGTTGWVAIGAGAGLGAASVWMFLRDKKDRRRTDVAVTPTRGGAFASVQFSW